MKGYLVLDEIGDSGSKVFLRDDFDLAYGYAYSLIMKYKKQFPDSDFEINTTPLSVECNGRSAKIEEVQIVDYEKHI